MPLLLLKVWLSCTVYGNNVSVEKICFAAARSLCSSKIFFFSFYLLFFCHCLPVFINMCYQLNLSKFPWQNVPFFSKGLYLIWTALQSFLAPVLWLHGASTAILEFFSSVTAWNCHFFMNTRCTEIMLVQLSFSFVVKHWICFCEFRWVLNRFSGNERGSLAQAAFQGLSIARRMLCEVADMDTSA